MEWSTILVKLFNPYDLKARIFPGLLILLPTIVFLVLVYGTKNPALVALASVLLGCGGPYFLASFVRTWGQRAQVKLYHEWGGQPTTILLRHRDTRLPVQTKLRYHNLAQQKLGINMPTPADEGTDPHVADQSYAAAADALRPRTVDSKKFPFVFKELVAYGFNRNAYGSRWAGAAVSASTAIATLIHGGLLVTPNHLFDVSAIKSFGITHVLSFAVAVVLFCVWLLHFTPKTVEQSGFSYALRLWEALEKVSKR